MSEMSKVTKKTALEWFRTSCWPYQKHQDITAKREAWNNYTDHLCKCGRITLKQYETWTNPF